jgi:heme exporter protein B
MAFSAAFRREFQLLQQRSADVWLTLAFAVLVAVLFGIALAGSANRLAAAGPAILFTTVLLAQFLAVSRLFAEDLEDGTLDQLQVSPASLSAVMYGKVMGFWCINGLALTLMSPMLAMLLRLPSDVVPSLMLSIAIVSLGLSLLGLIGAALTVRLRGGAMLLALIVLPLKVPLLVFGLGAVVAAIDGLSPMPGLAWAGFETVLLLALAPPLAAMGLQVTSE